MSSFNMYLRSGGPFLIDLSLLIFYQISQKSGSLLWLCHNVDGLQLVSAY